MRNIFLTILLLSSLNHYLQGQNRHPFFPHHAGDLWEYDEWEFWGLPLSKFHAIITSDSLDSLGNSHICFINNVLWPRGSSLQAWPINEFIIDTAYNVYHQEWGGLPQFLVYKLDAQQGDQWVMYTHSPGQYEMARCSKVEMRTIFNQPRQTKVFSYYLAFDTTDTTGLMRSYSYLAEGIGLIFEGGTFDAGYELHLWGAVIDGVLYGDTTYLNLDDHSGFPSVPDRINLYQNYPNPFNSTTQVTFNLDKNREVMLSLYDINGRLIKIIFNGNLESGIHRYQLNITDLPSGIYIYSLKSGVENHQKKCILIK